MKSPHDAVGATSPARPTPSGLALAITRGAFDLHVHVAPDVMPRRVTDLELAHRFLERDLRGFVLKSHYTSTAERAAVVRAAVPGIEVLGSITLNSALGGLNPLAVEVAAREGARIVWLPTVDAEDEARVASARGHEAPGVGHDAGRAARAGDCQCPLCPYSTGMGACVKHCVR